MPGGELLACPGLLPPALARSLVGERSAEPWRDLAARMVAISGSEMPTSPSSTSDISCGDWCGDGSTAAPVREYEGELEVEAEDTGEMAALAALDGTEGSRASPPAPTGSFGA